MRIAAAPHASRDGVTNELEELFRAHYELVYRTAFSVTGSRQDAEDVLQTIFLRLLRRTMPPDLTKNPKAYFYRAAINLSLNTVRGRKRETTDDEIARLPAPVVTNAADADDEMRRHLVRAIAQLPPRAVEILILRYEHDYSDAEIAKMLGKSRGSIAVGLYRTRVRLRKLLNATLGEEL